MPATTSLKLPEALKSQIASVAAREGKSAHALMVDTLQAAMDDAALRQQFYADGIAAHAGTMASNVAYDGDDVFAWMRAKVRGENPAWPTAKPYRTKAAESVSAASARKPAKALGGKAKRIAA